jgi:hypothetical protein
MSNQILIVDQQYGGISMEASFCSCDFDEPRPDPLSETYPTARKEHWCCECGDKIRKGEKYQLVKGKWGDGWGTYHTCMTCSRIRNDYCSYFGELWGTIRDALGEECVTGGVEEDSSV